MSTIIPFDDRDGYIWMDGKMLPWREAKLHVLCHGLHYGGSVFEGERIYDGQIFKLREHSVRFKKSAELLDFEIPMSVEEIENVSREICEANGIRDGYVRPLAWRGPEQLAVSAPNVSTRVAFACWQWPKYFFPKDGKGIALQTSKWRRADPRSMPVQSKAAGIYMVGTMAKHAAERAGFDDALLLDLHGRVAESTGSNIFMVKDGALKTPTPECFLNGITRQTIIKLARDLGYTVEETIISPEELLTAQELFVTGTAAEIMPIGRIDEKDFVTGPITKHLMEAYSALVLEKPQNAKKATA